MSKVNCLLCIMPQIVFEFFFDSGTFSSKLVYYAFKNEKMIHEASQKKNKKTVSERSEHTGAPDTINKQKKRFEKIIFVKNVQAI